MPEVHLLVEERTRKLERVRNAIRDLGRRFLLAPLDLRDGRLRHAGQRGQRGLRVASGLARDREREWVWGPHGYSSLLSDFLTTSVFSVTTASGALSSPCADSGITDAISLSAYFQ